MPIRTLLVLFALALSLGVARPAEASNITKQTRYFEFVYPEGHHRVVGPLIKDADWHYERFVELLGGIPAELDSTLVSVVVTRDRESFQRAQPARGGVDTWAAGTAYPSLNLIILTLEPDQYFDISAITRHEISHIAVHRVSQGTAPRWLDEGLAILHAGEEVIARVRTAASAALGGQLLPLAELSRRFPSPTHKAQLAYAQSVLFVRYLIEYHALRTHLPRLLRELRRGQPFSAAFAEVFGVSLAVAESDWHTRLDTTSTWVGVVPMEELFWVLCVVCFLVAYRVKRRRKRERLAQMEQDETGIEHWPPTPL